MNATQIRIINRIQNTTLKFSLFMFLLFLFTQLGVAQIQPIVSSFEERVKLFDYEATDLGVRKIEIEKKGNVMIEDVTFIGVPGEDPVKAYIVSPEASGSFAGLARQDHRQKARSAFHAQTAPRPPQSLPAVWE